MPRDSEWLTRRERAKVLVAVLAKFEKNFNDPSRRKAPLKSAELRTLDECAKEARSLLGEGALVSAMIDELQVLIFEVERASLEPAKGKKKLTFDAAHRHIGPILAALQATYDVAGPPGSLSAAKPDTRPHVVARIDEARLLGDDSR